MRCKRPSRSQRSLLTLDTLWLTFPSTNPLSSNSFPSVIEHQIAIICFSLTHLIGFLEPICSASFKISIFTFTPRLSLLLMERFRDWLPSSQNPLRPPSISTVNHPNNISALISPRHRFWPPLSSPHQILPNAMPTTSATRFISSR